MPTPIDDIKGHVSGSAALLNRTPRNAQVSINASVEWIVAIILTHYMTELDYSNDSNTMPPKRLKCACSGHVTTSTCCHLNIQKSH